MLCPALVFTFTIQFWYRFCLLFQSALPSAFKFSVALRPQTLGTARDREGSPGWEPRTSTSTFTQLLSYAISVEPLHCHDVTWKWPTEVWNLKLLSLFVCFLALACEKIFITMHSTKRACVIGPENVLLLRCVHASFSLEIVQAGAVKGLSSVML